MDRWLACEYLRFSCPAAMSYRIWALQVVIIKVYIDRLACVINSMKAVLNELL